MSVVILMKSWLHCSYRPSKKSQNQFNQVDPTGRFGIGMAFQTDLQPAAPESTPDVPVLVQSPVAATGPVTVYTSPSYSTPLHCDLCGVSANRQDQLETHKRGARHLRMLRLNGLPVPELGNNRKHDTQGTHYLLVIHLSF